MTRSKKKLPYVDAKLLLKVQKIKEAVSQGSYTKTSIKTWSRRSTIVAPMIGVTFEVHNGHKFISVTVDSAKVGHKLGEFSPTRKFGGHPEKSKEDNKKKGAK